MSLRLGLSGNLTECILYRHRRPLIKCWTWTLVWFDDDTMLFVSVYQFRAVLRLSGRGLTHDLDPSWLQGCVSAPPCSQGVQDFDMIIWRSHWLECMNLSFLRFWIQWELLLIIINSLTFLNAACLFLLNMNPVWVQWWSTKLSRNRSPIQGSPPPLW
jgi:hypothetical protein